MRSTERQERRTSGDVAAALTDKAQRCLGEGLTRDAIALAEQALATCGEYLPALAVKTRALLAERDFRGARESAQRALDLDPRNTSQLNNKGVALQGLGDCEGSLAAFTEALAIDPKRIEAYVDRSAILLELDRYAEALEIVQQGLLHDSNNRQLLINQGTALLGLERYQEALTITDTALAHHPGDQALLANRTLALLGLRRFPEALGTVSTCVRAHTVESGLLDAIMQELLDAMDYPAACAILDDLTATDPSLRANLLRRCAQQLLEQDRLEEALQACEVLLQADGSDCQALILQGRALARLMRFQEANGVLRRAERLYRERLGRPLEPPPHLPPDSFVAEFTAETEYLTQEFKRIEACDWSRWKGFMSRLPELVQSQLAAGKTSPLGAHNALLLPLYPALQQAIAASLSHHIARHVGNLLPLSREDTGSRSHDGKLRIGYCSGDFRDHATAHLMQGMFAQHDRDRFEIAGYALTSDDGNAYRRRIAVGCDRFVDLSESSNAEAARRIREDGIDILVDLMGFTYSARTEIFALRPAPVQVSYLGYPGTMGADFIQYIIADLIVLPASLRPFFAEQPVYLPECYQVTDRQPIAETGIDRAAAGLPEEAFVFCCFNGNVKIEPSVFEIWMRLLQQVPNSVLWLLERSPAAPENLWREARKHGIEAQRIIFAKPVEKSRHLERHRLADLFLDTFTCNAHTTASDALWVGVPVLTRRGATFPSRVAASLLTAVGLPDLITDTAEDYERLALHLATHPAALREIRDRLQQNRLTWPLFDTGRFVRHLEDALEAMWANHVSGRSPQPIHVRARKADRGK